jgi:hypothetical protein
MFDKLTILICLYNKDISDSATLQSLLKFTEVAMYSKVFIWDNSIEPVSSESLIILQNNFKNLIYKHTPENTVLSIVYNYVIDNLECDSYIMLCDDDSHIPEDFFKKLEEQITRNPSVNLFLPQVYSNSVLVSPAKDYLITTSFIKDLKPGLLASRYTTAINSGMVISNRFFEEGFRYDTRLRFYGTDNFFMNIYAQRNKELIVLDVKFSHNLSFNSSNDINNKLRIFKEVKRANKIIYSNQFFKRQIVLFNNFIVSVKLCLRYKTLVFLFN